MLMHPYILSLEKVKVTHSLTHSLTHPGDDAKNNHHFLRKSFDPKYWWILVKILGSGTRRIIICQNMAHSMGCYCLIIPLYGHWAYRPASVPLTGGPSLSTGGGGGRPCWAHPPILCSRGGLSCCCLTVSWPGRTPHYISSSKVLQPNTSFVCRPALNHPDIPIAVYFNGLLQVGGSWMELSASLLLFLQLLCIQLVD